MLLRPRDGECDEDHAGRCAATALLCTRYVGVPLIINEIARDAIERGDPCVSLYANDDADEAPVKH